MTEKRFELVFEDYDTFSIRDNDYIKENKHYHTLQEIVELLNQLDKDSKKLNELHEENQRLKSIFQLERRDLIEQNNNYRQSLNERLRKENDEWVVDYNGLHTECAGCQEENKSLRQKVDFYKDFQKDARELEEENDRLKKANKKLNKLCIKYRVERGRLEEENEQLEEENEDLNEELMEYDSFVLLYKEQRDELKEENEQLKQFKEKVFNLINTKIEEYEKDYDCAVRAGTPSIIIYDEIESLEWLKKELEE